MRFPIDAARPANPAMTDRQEFEAMLLANLVWIDRVVGALARRHGLSVDDQADFSSWVKLKLLENDYRVLRSFRGESSITTYLTTVIAMVYRDYRTQRWGRWRPSAAALRLGRLAVRLECLIFRDGLTLAAAAELLRTSGETADSDLQLSRLLATLPRRPPLRPIVEAIDSSTPPAPESERDPAVDEEAYVQRRVTETALERAVAELPSEDRVVLQMHYWQGASVADISRALGLEQRPLYRRLTRLHGELRRQLEAAGISPEHARDLMDEPAV